MCTSSSDQHGYHLQAIHGRVHRLLRSDQHGYHPPASLQMLQLPTPCQEGVLQSEMLTPTILPICCSSDPLKQFPTSVPEHKPLSQQSSHTHLGVLSLLQPVPAGNDDSQQEQRPCLSTSQQQPVNTVQTSIASMPSPSPAQTASDVHHQHVQPHSVGHHDYHPNGVTSRVCSYMPGNWCNDHSPPMFSDQCLGGSVPVLCTPYAEPSVPLPLPILCQHP